MFSKEKITKAKSEQKRISGEADDVNKQNIYNCFSEKVPPLTCYNLDVHHPIMIIFSRSVTKKVGNQTLFYLPTLPI